MTRRLTLGYGCGGRLFFFILRHANTQRARDGFFRWLMHGGSPICHNSTTGGGLIQFPRFCTEYVSLESIPTLDHVQQDGCTDQRIRRSPSLHIVTAGFPGSGHRLDNRLRIMLFIPFYHRDCCMNIVDHFGPATGNDLAQQILPFCCPRQ